jgi:hypothetical protein
MRSKGTSLQLDLVRILLLNLSFRHTNMYLSIGKLFGSPWTVQYRNMGEKPKNKTIKQRIYYLARRVRLLHLWLAESHTLILLQRLN